MKKIPSPLIPHLFIQVLVFGFLALLLIVMLGDAGNAASDVWNYETGEYIIGNILGLLGLWYLIFTSLGNGITGLLQLVVFLIRKMTGKHVSKK